MVCANAVTQRVWVKNVERKRGLRGDISNRCNGGSGVQKALGKRDACGGGGTVDIDDLCSLADGLEEEVQFDGCVCGRDSSLRGRLQTWLVETGLP